MLIRLMGDTPIVEPDIRQVAAGMGMIIDKVADYKSRPSSIGFSFRFYLAGMIRNPDIKQLSVNGIVPTAENIRNGSYPIIAPVYAVTYKDNPNENVARLIDWILSDEGQYIIEETGYVGIR
jgi:phosphate transport system substrate-binding protein